MTRVAPRRIAALPLSLVLSSALSFLLLLGAFLLAAPPAGATRGFHGSLAGWPLNRPIVGMAGTPSGRGYWLVASDGGIFTFGDARFHGSTGNIRLNRPIVGMARTPSGRGYWLVASDGGIFTFGDARFLGSTGNIRLNRPIVGMATTSTGRGYWLVASDGGIFTFGDARFHGSTGNIRLARPVVAVSPTRSNRGYRLLASDGGLFSFGDARFLGSAARMGRRFSSIVRSPSGAGYLLVGTAGEVAAFGDARSYGSADPLGTRVVGVSRRGPLPGYWLATADGIVLTFVPETRRLPSGVTAAPPPSTGWVAREVFRRANTERRARGLEPLLWDSRLAGAARSWSVEMSRSGFRHSNLRAAMAGTTYTRVGENIFAGGGWYADAGSAHSTWMFSDPHRVNLVQPAFTTIGIGGYCDGFGRLWMTQEFGAHRSVGGAGYRPSAPLPPVASPDQNGAHC